MKRRNVAILGAAGRDYWNFLMKYKDNPYYDVKFFTQAQIPGIERRSFPKELAGRLYKKDIPFFTEEKLPELIKKYKINDVVFSYSDVSHEDVMHKASIVLANGANFVLLGPFDTMLKSKKKVISVCAVRTGSGKSQTTRYVARLLKELGKKVVIIRHPMPYGDLRKQAVQRFAVYEDFKKHNCTIEEMEEYEQHINEGNVVYAGVNYKKILELAEKECDVILFDGGNNDFSFYKSDLLIVVADPHRPGHEILYHPGETNLRMADVIIINKVNTAKKKNIELIKRNIKKYNPKAIVFEGASEIHLEPKIKLEGKKVMVIEDGPTLTHGNMKYGAGFIISKKSKAKIIDPNLYAKGAIKNVLKRYELEKVVPAMGYSKEEVQDLEKTINASPCEYIVDASPVNLERLIKTKKQLIQVKYDLRVKGNLKSEIKKAIQ